MTPLPPALSGTAELIAWRLDRIDRAAQCESGEGARLYGGRWNGVGQRAVYLSLDPSTTILEKAAHTGFSSLDLVPHIMMRIQINELAAVMVVWPEDLPTGQWLNAGMLSLRQQAFGNGLLAAYEFIVIPSAVSNLSWNLVFDPARAIGKYSLRQQIPFILDRQPHRNV